MTSSGCTTIRASVIARLEKLRAGDCADPGVGNSQPATPTAARRPTTAWTHPFPVPD